MKLIQETDKLLQQKCPQFTFDNTVDLEELAALMLKFMADKRGLGLAAPQVGLLYNLFVMYEKPYLMVNPDIIQLSEDIEKLSEGCLSFSGLILPIERSKSIVVTYQNIKGEFITEEFSGLTARIIQHEVDHLNGITIRQRVSKLTYDIADRKRKKAIKENIHG